MQDNKNTSVVHKGGKFIVQDNSQKGEENTYLMLFMETPEGKEWCSKNGIVKRTLTESPDFIFETSDNKIIGLEITNLIIKTNKYHATVTLHTIAKQICQHFKKEKGVALSILIDIWDPRKWSGKWKDHLDYRDNPGFDYLGASKTKIKEAIIAEISKEDVSTLWHRKEWITIGSQMLCVTVDRMFDPHVKYNVNNTGRCKEDPFEELQKTIDKKNKKLNEYKAKCQACDLLVVFDNDVGNYAFFSDKIKIHKFSSAFRSVYLLDLRSWISDRRITKLETT